MRTQMDESVVNKKRETKRVSTLAQVSCCRRHRGDQERTKSVGAVSSALPGGTTQRAMPVQYSVCAISKIKRRDGEYLGDCEDGVHVADSTSCTTSMSVWCVQ